MPTPLGVPITLPTGRKNMLASIRQYLEDNLPGEVSGSVPYFVKWEQYLEAADFPSISFEDFGVPNLGGYVVDEYVGQYADSNVKVHGKICQTMIELNLQTNEEDSTKAVEQLYQMADQLEYLFHYSSMGVLDENNVRVMPRIALLDFDNSNVDTGATVWAPLEKDAIWIPSYIGTEPDRPGIRRLSIKVRIFWHWLRPAITST